MKAHGGLRSNSKRSRKARHVLAMSSMLGLACCFVPIVCILAEEQHTPLASADADTQIASLLNKIESELIQDQAVSFYPLIDMSLAAKALRPSASPEGRQLIRDFPARLQRHANQELNGGDPVKAVNITAFAESVAPYIGQDANEPVRSGPVKPEAAAAAPSQTPPGPPKAATAAKPETSAAPVTAAAPATAPSPAAPAPVKREAAASGSATATPALPASVQRSLLDRGNAMLKLGDVSAARMLFARAAGLGSGVAALRLANTYDPAFLQDNNLLGIRPDPVAAETWYRKAAALGETEAEQRLKSLDGRKLTNVLTTR